MHPIGILCLAIACIGFADAGGSCSSCDSPNLNFLLTGYGIAFPCDSTRNIYLQTGRYVPKNMIATRTQIYKDNVILALPRLKHGSPFTLATFSLKAKECRPTLVPYPCWSLQEEGNCNALQSVTDIFLDPAELLWVLDSGIVNTLEQPVKRCPPKIVAVNAKTGQTVKIVDLTPYTTSTSKIQQVLVNYNTTGHPFVFVSDAGSGAIICCNIYLGTGFRMVLPKAVSAGCTSNDVMYMALITRNDEKRLYFTYLNSDQLFYVSVTALSQFQPAGAVVHVGTKPNKMVFLGTDDGSSLFFRYKGHTDIYVWNTLSCFKPNNFILVQSGDSGRLATHVVPGFKRLMWVLESNFQDYLNNTVSSLGASIAVHPLIKSCDL